MTEHNRWKGCWQYYEAAKDAEQLYLKKTLIDLIRETPYPRGKKRR